MIFLKKIICVTVIFSVICFYFPMTVFARADSIKGITKHSVKTSTTPEEKIPVKTVEKKKPNKWLWVGLGVGALALGGAAAAGGGGGDDDSSTPAGSDDKGDIKVSW